MSIGLNQLCNWSCDFMILQLFSFLDTNFDKRVVFEIMALVEKNLLNLIKN